MSGIRTWNDAGLAWIEIDRPEKLNALDRPALAALRDAVAQAVDSSDTRVLLLTGAGERAFCAGADISAMRGLDAAGIRTFMDLGKEVTLLLEEAPQPTIAVVNGYALGGGCELTLACDLVYASDSSCFALPEVDLGLLPGWGATQRLERRIGYGRAREMLFTARRLASEEALAWGLCDCVFPASQLRDRAATVASAMSTRDPLALAVAKRALQRRAELPLREGLALETDTFVDLFDRPETAALIERFLSR